MNIKSILLLLCSIGLAGCGAKTSLVYETFKEAIATPPNYELTAEQLDKFPYAAIYGQLDDGPQAVIVLAFVHGKERQWATAQRESLVTVKGRLIRTSGLPDNLAALNFDGQDPLSLPLEQMNNVSATGVVDIMPSYQFGVPFSSHVSVKQLQNIAIGPKQMQLTLVEESFSIPSLDYETTNRFWLDEHGLVRKSEQSVFPTLPRFRITLVKPFRGDLK